MRVCHPILLILSLLVAVFATGCVTDDASLSERPWNTQQNWEHGLPTGMNQGR